MSVGQEWIIDATGCASERLTQLDSLKALFDDLVTELELTVIGAPQWHTFPGPGGITGLALLSESHLAIHTFPEHGYAALSVYSCRSRRSPDFAAALQRHLNAARVEVRELVRGSSVLLAEQSAASSAVAQVRTS